MNESLACWHWRVRKWTRGCSLKIATVRNSILLKMKENTTTIDLNGEVLLDIDYSTDANFLGITDKNYVVSKFDRFRLNREFKFPIIRQINDTYFLVAETRVDERSDN